MQINFITNDAEPDAHWFFRGKKGQCLQFITSKRFSACHFVCHKVQISSVAVRQVNPKFISILSVSHITRFVNWVVLRHNLLERPFAYNLLSSFPQRTQITKVWPTFSLSQRQRSFYK